MFSSLLTKHSCAAADFKRTDIIALDDAVPSMSAQNVANGLPLVVSAVAREDEEARICAMATLIAVGLRSDSAVLLRPYLEDIGLLLRSPDARLRRGAAAVLIHLQPHSPPETLPIWLDYLRSQSGDSETQATAIGALVRSAPQEPKVAEAVKTFWSKPIDRLTRERTLNALADPRITDPGLVKIVIECLSSDDRDIRFRAVQVIRRMGRPAIQQAEPVLRRIAQDNPAPEGDETERRTELQIREFARQALHLLEIPPTN